MKVQCSGAGAAQRERESWPLYVHNVRGSVFEPILPFPRQLACDVDYGSYGGRVGFGVYEGW